MLNYLLAAAIGAMSALLANKNVAVYNDGFRPVYTEYFSGRMDRKSLAATSFAVSFGLIVGFGFTNSIAMGIIIIHTFLLMGDIIGTWCPDTPKGTILSVIIGAIWGSYGCCLYVLNCKSLFRFTRQFSSLYRKCSRYCSGNVCCLSISRSCVSAWNKKGRDYCSYNAGSVYPG